MVGGESRRGKSSHHCECDIFQIAPFFYVTIHRDHIRARIRE